MEKLYALLFVRMPVKFAHWIRMRLKFFYEIQIQAAQTHTHTHT